MNEPEASAGPARQALGVFAGVTLATVGISLAGRLPQLSDYVHLAVGVLFLSVGVHMAARSPGGLERHGLSLGGLLEPTGPTPEGLLAGTRDLIGALLRGTPAALRELGWALAVAALIFPPFVVGFRIWNAPQHPFQLSFPPELPSYVLAQLLVVALPEEAFFRGYIQGRMSDAMPRRRRLLGASLSPSALVLTSSLFALIHVAVDPHPARLAVFFPALLFGWLRELRGGIGAAVFLHALSNLLGDVLARSWL